MKTISLDVFSIDELSREARERAIEKNRYINVEHDQWDDGIIEAWLGELAGKGYEDAKIMYNGFYSQGDGACFTASVDIEKYLKAHKLTKRLPVIWKNRENVHATITHSWRYYFATSTNVNVDYDGDDIPRIDEELRELENIITDEREKLGNEIYSELREDYEAMTEDDSVVDTLRINEYTFLPNGEMFNH